MRRGGQRRGECLALRTMEATLVKEASCFPSRLTATESQILTAISAATFLCGMRSGMVAIRQALFPYF